MTDLESVPLLPESPVPAEAPASAEAPAAAEAPAGGGDRAGDGVGVPGDLQTKHPWESNADFSSRKGRFTYGAHRVQHGAHAIVSAHPHNVLHELYDAFAHATCIQILILLVAFLVLSAYIGCSVMAIVFYERMPTDCHRMRWVLLRFAIAGLATVCLPVLAKLGSSWAKPTRDPRLVRSSAPEANPSDDTELIYKLFLAPSWLCFIFTLDEAVKGQAVRAFFFSWRARVMHANRGSAHFLTLLSCVQVTMTSPGQYCYRYKGEEKCWSEGATNPTRCGGDELWDEMEELFTTAIYIYAALFALPIGFILRSCFKSCCECCCGLRIA